LFLQSGHETKENRTLLRALGGRLTNQSYNIAGNLKCYPSILHKMVNAYFICGAKDVRLLEIPSNMKQNKIGSKLLKRFAVSKFMETMIRITF
jgi:hypothetical protein